MGSVLKIHKHKNIYGLCVEDTQTQKYLWALCWQYWWLSRFPCCVFCICQLTATATWVNRPPPTQLNDKTNTKQIRKAEMSRVGIKLTSSCCYQTQCRFCHSHDFNKEELGLEYQMKTLYFLNIF